MSNDLTDEILENAQGPKSASGDAGSMTQHTIAEQIAADRYLKGETGVDKTPLGLRFRKLKHPGA